MATSDTGKEQKNTYDGNLNIEYANSRIIVRDGTTKRLLIGTDDDGNIKVKLSLIGQDVLTATDDQLVFSSDFDMFKIVDKGTITLAFTGTDTFKEVQVSHNLSYTPRVIAFFTDGTSYWNMPYIGYTASGGNNVIARVAEFIIDQTYISAYMSRGSAYTGSETWYVNYFLLAESQ